MKKGADKGIDGVVYFSSGAADSHRAILQAKSGHVKRGDIAALRGDMEREEAQVAFFLTLEEPTKPMRDEAAQCGLYHSPHTGLKMNRLQIISVRQILEDGAHEKRRKLARAYPRRPMTRSDQKERRSIGCMKTTGRYDPN